MSGRSVMRALKFKRLAVDGMDWEHALWRGAIEPDRVQADTVVLAPVGMTVLAGAWSAVAVEGLRRVLGRGAFDRLL